MRTSPLSWLLTFLACLVLAPRAHAAPKKPKPAKILVSPGGAMLKTGQSVTFSAVVVDKKGNVLPDLAVTWKAKPASILSITPEGVATANGTGKATVVAKVRGKKTKTPVYVLNAGGGSSETVAVGLKQVNHILEDGEWLYWCETSAKLTRVRKMHKSGGAILDLASEPFQTKSGLSTTFVHLQQIGDRLYFSRQQKGFVFHWSILSVPKEGGPVTTVLPNDVGQEPLSTNAWRVAGGRIVASLEHPDKIGLGSAARVAVYDPATDAWTPIFGGQFDAGEVHLIAVDNQFAYVRGYSRSNRQTRIVKVDLDNVLDPQTLHVRDGLDDDRKEPGATDGTNLYYWTRRDDGHRLVSLSTEGGNPVQLLNTAFGPGLTYNDGFLYWARNEQNIVKLPVGGGTITPVRGGIYATAAIGGIPIDDTSAYVAVVASRKEIQILRVAK
jgi:hypothetical protein